MFPVPDTPDAIVEAVPVTNAGETCPVPLTDPISIFVPSPAATTPTAPEANIPVTTVEEFPVTFVELEICPTAATPCSNASD
jgi:hypothetical protein